MAFENEPASQDAIRTGSVRRALRLSPAERYDGSGWPSVRIWPGGSPFRLSQSSI